MKLFLFSCLLVLCISSCKKVDQSFPKPACKVTRFHTLDYEGKPLIGTYSYTSWGAPRAITLSEESTGLGSYFFHYDSKRNLTGFIYGYTPTPGDRDTAFLLYRKFIYQNGKIVGDSIFDMATLSSLYINENDFSIGKYSYDGYGRIIHYEERHNGAIVWKTSFNYPNENPYVKNTNFMGTHPVLMFISMDYNRKNRNVRSFNSFGYPTEFTEGYWFYNIQINKVEYDCNTPGKG